MRGYVIMTGVLWVGIAWGGDSSDALFQAVRNNDLAFLRAQFAKGADVNSRDRRESTLLMHAAAFGSPEAVKLLLASGADVNARNSLGATALLWGADNPAIARLLVDKGADVNAASAKFKRTPLMIAARCDGCSETVSLLLSKGADPKAKGKQGETAFEIATGADDLETMRLLLARGAEADAADEAGNTPLQLAASNCSLPAINMLLSRGARVNSANTFSGQVKFGLIQIIHVTPLMWAAPFCSSEIIKTLLDAGADVTVKDVRQMTALMLAVASERQDVAVVRLLLKAGADVNVKSAMGETALDWARKFGAPEVIAVLTAAGARPGDPFAPPRLPAAAPRTPMQSIESSTALLQRTSTEFFRQSGCVGCHHQPFTVMAVSAAKAHGARVDENALREHVQMMDSEATGFQEPMLERVDLGGLSDPPMYSLLARAAASTPPTNITDTLVTYVAAMQHRDGTWQMKGISRAPVEESVIARTAMAMHVLQAYGPPGRKADFDRRIARARDYLLRAKVETNDDLAMQLAGLYWAGDDRTKLQPLGRALITRQRDDGGWAPNRNLPSDAFATGESLWALKEAGVVSPSDPPYQRGVKYLLSTQWQDGSWYVRSRAVKFQPYFQSGFPYNHDQWISSSATAWAVMALAPAADLEKRAAR